VKKRGLDLRDRQASFAALEAETFDLLIIGAGITGCGAARDAAMRGLRVALIDANDIGAGTSSRSSRLVHGGLRYLAQGDVMVVRQAANERKVLRRIAKHLTKYNPMVILPRSKRGTAAIRAALWSYEKIGHVDKSERHEVWDRERLRIEEPHVLADNFTGAVVYPEYLTDDGRLTLANAISAASAGAVIVTYAAAEETIIENDRVTGAVVHNTLPGFESTAMVQARVVVNAAGPWVDRIRLMEDSQAKKKLQLTKGIHVVVSRARLPINRTIIMNAPDRRSIFVIPCGRFAYFGTTDTFYPDAEYWPEITRDDVDYLLNSAAAYFDVGPFQYQDIVALWSGIRPLLYEKGKKPSEISRRDEVLEGPAGLLSVAGGKLTSYRSMAEHLVDQCEKQLNRKPNPASTAEEPLPGGDFKGTVSDLESRVQRLGLSREEAERVVILYGAEALEIFKESSGPAVEAAHAVLNEGALTLEDYWVRRSARSRFDDDGGLAALEPAADCMTKLLNWSSEEKTRQIKACRTIRENELKAVR